MATPAGSNPQSEILRVFSSVSSDLDFPRVLARSLEGAQELFGARAGFIVLLDPSPTNRGPQARIAHFTGFTADALRAVAGRPDFRELLDTPGARTDRPGSPASLILGAPGLATWVMGVPLATSDRLVGRMVLTFVGPTEPGIQSQLTFYAAHVAQAIRNAAVHNEAVARRDDLAAGAFAIPTPMIAIDAKGSLSMVNAAASELFQLPGGFLGGQLLGDRLGTAVETLVAADGDGDDEVVLGMPPRVYRVSCRRVRGGPAKVLVFDDLTAIRDLEKLKADFVAVVGHELRTPLTVLRGYSETLQRRWRDLSDERRVEAVDALDQAARRLEQLIEGVLFISALDEHRPSLEVTEEQIGELLRGHAGDRVRVSLPVGEMDVAVDRAMFDVVLYQLVDNALKYSEGDVVLEAVGDGDDLLVSVHDRGPGIYSGDLPTLFEKFRQVDNTSTRRKGGMGLGLYMARRIVESLGGAIRCESSLGEGSTFVVRMPRRVEAVIQL